MQPDFESKTKEEILQELRNYRTIFEISGAGIAIVEDDATISSVNTAFEKLFGYSKEEFEGKQKWTELCVAEDRDRINNYHRQRRVEPTRAPHNYEARFIHRNGSFVDAYVTAALIPETKKSVLDLIDISDLKRAEEALHKSHEELESRVKERTAELEKLNEALQAEVEERKRAEEIISRQSKEILEISTPVLQIWERIVSVPLIGTLDSMRTQQLVEQLLQRIVETNSLVALIDVTGVPAIDTQTAQHLIETISAVRLLGAQVVLTGIRPAIAQTLVHLGIDLSNVNTCSSLSAGLGYALDLLKMQVVHKA